MRSTIDAARAARGESTGFEANGISADPLFVDAANHVFTLQAGSPAIDAGVVIQGFNDPQSAWPFAGSGPDMGAFEVGGPDIVPPTRIGGQPSGVLPSGTTQATMSLSTDEDVTCKYSGSPGVAFANMTSTFATTGSTLHTTLFTGLTDGTSYSNYIRCEDGSGNENQDDFLVSFEVEVPDEIPPVRSNGQPSGTFSVGTTDVEMSLDTDEVATCKYSDSPGTAFDALPTTFTNTSSTLHTETLSGLMDGTSYSYYIRCQDGSGNRNDDDYPISFDIEDPDLTPPVMSGVSVTQGATSVTVGWETDDESDSKVSYGLSKDALSVIADPALVTSHSVQLDGLIPNSKYFWKAESCNSDGTCGIFAYYSVTTLQQLSFAPSEDAYVRENDPDTNFGSVVTVEVDGDDPSGSGKLMWFFLKFDLSGIPSDILSAEIRLYNTNSSDKGGDLFALTDTGWTESAITWNTKPGIDGVLVDSLGVVNSGQWYSFDVTTAITGDGAYSFAALPASTNGADYYSKEGINPPVLEVVFWEGGPPQSVPTLTHWGLAAMGVLIMAASMLWRRRRTHRA